MFNFVKHRVQEKSVSFGKNRLLGVKCPLDFSPKSTPMTTPRKSQNRAKPPQRRPDQTILGVSMPKELKARIKTAAAADRRPMATWAVLQLERICDELEAAAPPKRSHGKKAREL
jgi:hypothetical protein